MKQLIPLLLINTLINFKIYAQTVEIQGQLKINQTPSNNLSDSFLVKHNNGIIGLRDKNTLPFVPNSSVLISEMENDTNFIEAGYINTGYFILDKHIKGNDSIKYGEWESTSLINAPAARQNHSSVWTGSKIIIFGGDLYNGNYPINSGGIFDPQNNTWTSISLANAPSARSSHIGIWTGNEMIIWGGSNETGLINTGGIYYLSSDTWTTMATNNAPSPRYSYVSIWTGQKLIIWGGQGVGGLLNTGAVYDVLTNTWTTMELNNAPEPRTDFSSIWTGSELIIWGGAKANNIKLNNGSRYNVVTNSWTPISLTNAPEARYEHSGIWTGTEMIIWGGRNINNNFLNSGLKYNPISDTWQNITTSGLEARTNHYSFWINNEMIIWGGSGFDIQGKHYTNGAKYNPVNNTWVMMSPSNLEKPYFEIAMQAGNNIIFWSDYFTESRNTGAKYNTISNLWTRITNKNEPSERVGMTYEWMGDKMIIWGGYLNISNDVTNTGVVYDPNATGYSPSYPTLYYVYQKM